MYGELVMADGEYGGSKGRRWKVDWNRSPQPIQVKLKCLRGIKDKLPGLRRKYFDVVFDFIIPIISLFESVFPVFVLCVKYFSYFQLVVTC